VKINDTNALSYNIESDVYREVCVIRASQLMTSQSDQLSFLFKFLKILDPKFNVQDRKYKKMTIGDFYQDLDLEMKKIQKRILDAIDKNKKEIAKMKTILAEENKIKKLIENSNRKLNYRNTLSFSDTLENEFKIFDVPKLKKKQPENNKHDDDFLKRIELEKIDKEILKTNNIIQKDESGILLTIDEAQTLSVYGQVILWMISRDYYKVCKLDPNWKEEADGKYISFLKNEVAYGSKKSAYANLKNTYESIEYLFEQYTPYYNFMSSSEFEKLSEKRKKLVLSYKKFDDFFQNTVESFREAFVYNLINENDFDTEYCDCLDILNYSKTLLAHPNASYNQTEYKSLSKEINTNIKTTKSLCGKCQPKI